MAVLSPIKYAAANVSVRGRLAKRLSSDSWAELLAASDFSHAVSLLARTPYREMLRSTTADHPEPAQVEQELWAYLAQAFRAPLKFIQGSAHELLDWLWRNFELENLKTILRTVEQDVPVARVRASLVPLGSASKLPWDRLVEASSVSAVIDQLRATFHGERYARALSQALNQYEREEMVFVLEVALDLAYFRRLLRLINNLSGQDRHYADRFIGTRINGQNLLWAFRYRTYFDLSPEEILNYTLPHSKLQVDASVVQRIAIGAPLGSIVRQVWGDDLPGLDRLAELSPEEALPELELVFQRYLYDLALKALRGYPFHLGTILAYEIVLESEARDLITIVEGKAAGRSAQQIQPHLIGSRA